jgi:hypothetical protein
MKERAGLVLELVADDVTIKPWGMLLQGLIQGSERLPNVAQASLVRASADLLPEGKPIA